MRCPTCGGAGAFVYRRQVGLDRVDTPAGSSHRVTCARCAGGGSVEGQAGMPDDDGELPLGWSPPHRQFYPQWCQS